MCRPLRVGRGVEAFSDRRVSIRSIDHSPGVFEVEVTEPPPYFYAAQTLRSTFATRNAGASSFCSGNFFKFTWRVQKPRPTTRAKRVRRSRLLDPIVRDSVSTLRPRM